MLSLSVRNMVQTHPLTNSLYGKMSYQIRIWFTGLFYTMSENTVVGVITVITIVNHDSKKNLGFEVVVELDSKRFL